MWKKIIFLSIFILCLSNQALAQDPQPGATGLNDPFYPLMGNGGYDVQHYTIDLTVDLRTNSIAGSTTIKAQATQDLSTFNLDFLGLIIGEITVDGIPVEFTRENSELTIMPAEPILAETLFQVVVTYSGIPNVIDSTMLGTEGWIRYPRGIHTFGEPFGAATFYPVNDHPTDKATYTFIITVEDPLVVATNGLHQETIAHDDIGWSTYIWEASDPMASYLVTINIAFFLELREETDDGIPIRSFFPPDVDDAMYAPHSRTKEMMDYFSELFGPYPFEAYGAVIMDMEFRAALETQTLSMFGRTTNEGVVAHELVHQWFGDSVTLASWNDIWLNEGFATYGEVLWVEKRFGETAMKNYIYEKYLQALTGKMTAPAYPTADRLFDQTVYIRGALVLHALRLEVGDELFFDILRTYHERFMYSNASTQDFIDVAEEISEKDLDELFEGWLYQDEMPEFPES